MRFTYFHTNADRFVDLADHAGQEPEPDERLVYMAVREYMAIRTALGITADLVLYEFAHYPKMKHLLETHSMKSIFDVAQAQFSLGVYTDECIARSKFPEVFRSINDMIADSPIQHGNSDNVYERLRERDQRDIIWESMSQSEWSEPSSISQLDLDAVSTVADYALPQPRSQPKANYAIFRRFDLPPRVTNRIIETLMHSVSLACLKFFQYRLYHVHIPEDVYTLSPTRLLSLLMELEKYVDDNILDQQYRLQRSPKSVLADIKTLCIKLEADTPFSLNQMLEAIDASKEFTVLLDIWEAHVKVKQICFLTRGVISIIQQRLAVFTSGLYGRSDDPADAATLLPPRLEVRDAIYAAVHCLMEQSEFLDESIGVIRDHEITYWDTQWPVMKAVPDLPHGHCPRHFSAQGPRRAREESDGPLGNNDSLGSGLVSHSTPASPASSYYTADKHQSEESSSDCDSEKDLDLQEDSIYWSLAGLTDDSSEDDSEDSDDSSSSHSNADYGFLSRAEVTDLATINRGEWYVIPPDNEEGNTSTE